MTEKENPLDGLIPKCPLMQIGWRDCLSWAITDSRIVERFRSDTGIQWTPARSLIDTMIDKATGAEVDFVRKFVEWFNENVWGDINESV